MRTVLWAGLLAFVILIGFAIAQDRARAETLKKPSKPSTFPRLRRPRNSMTHW
jgi:hypothetical protein